MASPLPFRISNIRSDICCVNLKFLQNLQIGLPNIHSCKVKNLSDLLQVQEKDFNFFEISQINENIKNWNCSNLHLGNLHFYFKNKQSSVCVFLDAKSNFVTVVNPKDKLKINSNQILEIVLESNTQDLFLSNASGIKNMGYKIYENNLISDIFGVKKFQHHIWMKFQSKFLDKINFSNNDKAYDFLLEVKEVKSKSQYYKRNISLVEKSRC